MEKEIIINRFETIGEDLRDLPNGQFRYLENLNIGDFNHSATQVVNVANTAAQTQSIVRLLKYGTAIYGLGWNSSDSDVRLYQFNTTTKVFDVLATSEVTGTLSNFTSFFSIMDGIVYFDGGNGYVCTYVLATNTLNASFQAITGGLNGGVNWKGALYGWSTYAGDRSIYKVTSTTLTQLVAIPNTQDVKQIIPYGNYLAIVCTASSVSDDGISRMYIWDGVTTTSFTEIVEIGTGVVTGGDLLDGAITVVQGFANKKGFRIKQYSGSGFQTLYTYQGRKNLVSNWVYSIPCSFVKSYTGFIYFIVSGARPGSSNNNVYETVLFRYGRKDINDTYKLSVYKDLQVLPGTSYAVGVAGGNDFIIYENDTYTDTTDNAIYAVVLDSATTTAQVYSTTAYSDQPGVIETSIYTFGDSSKAKVLKAINIQTAPLTSSGQITLKYRKDAEESWTTIFTNTTDDLINYTAKNIESSGDNLPNFNEIQFRIEILGGATITGFKAKAEELENIYG